MFTGIVQGTAKVVSIDDKPNFRTHVVELPAHMLEGLETGASVANNGCCLTVTDINGARMAGIAAGGLLAMLTNSLIPFSVSRGAALAGVGTVVGFVVSLVL